MFNNYIAKKREQKLYKRLQEVKKQINRKNKYHEEVQPQLLENYQQRLNSFMHQMNQNPIFIEEPPQKQPSNQHLHGFIYRNCEDWRSLRTISQRLYSQKNKKTSEKCSASSRKTSYQTEFGPNQTEYRIRNKMKQINQPMKFGKMIKQSAEIPRKKHQSLQPMKYLPKKQEESIENDDQNSLREMTGKESDANSDFFQSRGRVEDIEIDRELQQKRNSFKQNKRHFKKLMTLSLIGQEKHKKQIKMILDRCGYIKKKAKNGSESIEVDLFARIIEKIRQK